MKRIALTGAIAALSIGFSGVALAQTGVIPAPGPGAHALAPARVADRFSTGMVVRDSTGALVGRVARVDLSEGGGVTAIAVDMDGTLVHFAPDALTINSAGEAIAPETRAAINADAARLG
jgi:hypothetical protein